MKRLVDFTASLTGLLVTSPILALAALAIWLQDFKSPFYIAQRTGRNGLPFQMVKFRTMVIRADQQGVDSTAGDDPRITAVGRTLRRLKIDELPQLWNVLVGQMSLVGPRPNVPRETALYTNEEKRLLTLRPGITDFASIVFADEGDILLGSADPDLLYNQIIRPWKSRLGILYVERAGSVVLDLRIIGLTLLSAVSRDSALGGVSRLVANLGGDDDLVKVALRKDPLQAAPPPGAAAVVQSRS